MEFYESIIIEMIENNLSIREVAKKYNIPKSVLHRNLQKAKKNLPVNTQADFESLMLINKSKMREKRWQK